MTQCRIQRGEAPTATPPPPPKTKNKRGKKEGMRKGGGIIGASKEKERERIEGEKKGREWLKRVRKQGEENKERKKKAS